MKSKLLAAVLVLALPFAALRAEPQTFTVDTVHSGVSFEVRHFFNKVPGSFSNFEGTVVFDPENLEASSITGTVSIASVDTNNDGRDEHLQEDDYFDTQQFPVASFESTSWTQEDDDEYIVTGHLTILDTTREIEMELEFLGMGPGRRPGSVVTGWEGEFEIDRRDYGITSGQGVIGNEVEIELNIQAHLVTEE